VINDLLPLSKWHPLEIRTAAAKTCGLIREPETIESLLETLRESDADLKRASAWALGELDDRRAVEPLLLLLGDKDVNVKRVAVEILGKLGDERAVEILLEIWEALEAQTDKIEAQSLTTLMFPSVYSEVLASQVIDVVRFRNAIQQSLKKLGVDVEHVRGPLTGLIETLSWKDLRLGTQDETKNIYQDPRNEQRAKQPYHHQNGFITFHRS